MERRDTKTQSSCHAGFAIRRNPLFGFVIRIIYVGVADYKSARGVYGGLQIRRDKKSAVTKQTGKRNLHFNLCKMGKIICKADTRIWAGTLIFVS